MDRWRGKIAVVTGASSGMGAAFSKKLTEEGLMVIGLARRVKKIEEISNSLKDAPGKLYAIECDITVIEEVKKTFQWIKENVGIVQILINNAGVYNYGTFVEGNPELWKMVFDTNVLGLLYCSRQVLGQLKDTELQGHIIHINSLTGHYKYPGYMNSFLNAYSSSKNAVTCINDVMKQEQNFYKMPVKITSLSPGFVKDTEIHGDLSKLNIPENFPFLKLEDMNNAILYILQTPPHVHIQELILRPLGDIF